MGEAPSHTWADPPRLVAEQRLWPLPPRHQTPANSTASTTHMLWRPLRSSAEPFTLAHPQLARGEGVTGYVARGLAAAQRLLEEDDVAPTPKARVACSRLFGAVDSLWPALVRPPRPHTCAPGHGDISLEWSEGDRRLIVTVLSDGLVRLFCATVKDQRPTDARTISQPSPEETLGALQWLMGAG